jgi:uncharacterized membrane protein required for colicin V production
MAMSIYHRFLRVALLVTAFVLVFDSGVLFPVTKQLSQNAFTYLASSGTGVFASVPQNEINAQISEKERTLDARESALNEREIAARKFEQSIQTDYSTYIISVILFVIIVLLVLNYIMDFARNRKLIYAKQVG